MALKILAYLDPFDRVISETDRWKGLQDTLVVPWNVLIFHMI